MISHRNNIAESIYCQIVKFCKNISAIDLELVFTFHEDAWYCDECYRDREGIPISDICWYNYDYRNSKCASHFRSVPNIKYKCQTDRICGICNYYPTCSTLYSISAGDITSICKPCIYVLYQKSRESIFKKFIVIWYALLPILNKNVLHKITCQSYGFHITLNVSYDDEDEDFSQELYQF
jgi:hypothetical protein